MKTIILFISFLLIDNVPTNSVVTYGYAQQLEDVTIAEKVRRCLSKRYNQMPENLSISYEYINNVFNIYWSDPGFVEGPEIGVNGNFCIIKFSLTTYYDNKTVKYVDDFTYYIPLSDSKLLFIRNKYHGKNYHGGSFIIHKDGNSVEYEELQPPLVGIKTPTDIELEKIIKKD